MLFRGDVLRAVLTPGATPPLQHLAESPAPSRNPLFPGFTASQIQDSEDSFLSPFPYGTKFMGPSLPELVSAVSSRGCGGSPTPPPAAPQPVCATVGPQTSIFSVPAVFKGCWEGTRLDQTLVRFPFPSKLPQLYKAKQQEKLVLRAAKFCVCLRVFGM